MSAAAAAALLVLAVLAAALAWVRRRAAPGLPLPLAVSLRLPLAKDSGVAILRWNDRNLLVGYGAAGVSLLAAAGEEEAR